MDIEELYLSPSPMPDRIREPRFSTVKRGYDPGQVLEYLTRVADRIQALESRVRELESELQVAHQQPDGAHENQAPEGVDPFEVAAARVADLMKTFDREVGNLHLEAEAEASRIVGEARNEADKTRLDAQDHAEEMRVDAGRGRAEIVSEEGGGETRPNGSSVRRGTRRTRSDSMRRTMPRRCAWTRVGCYRRPETRPNAIYPASRRIATV